ncbi:MAG: hypothetical protein V7L20_10075 [Nostoc sp.]|uniref:hypothetical protein n=1 Tax=Nostoc sp. TaxID=1180 RepID=UPI002FF5EEA1
MHHSLKIKIWDLDHIESIVEQDITDVGAEKIVGGRVVCAPNDYYCLMNVPSMPDDPLPSCIIVNIEVNLTKIISKSLLTKDLVNVATNSDLSLDLSKSASKNQLM